MRTRCRVHRSIAVAAGAVMLTALAGCGDDEDLGTPTTTAPTTTADDAGDTTTSTVDDPGDTTTSAPDADGGPDLVGDPGTEMVESEGFPSLSGETALLVDVRTSSHDGFDRVVLEFEGADAPTYRVAYIDPPVRQAGSGNEIEVAGDTYLEIRATPAAGYDPLSDDAEETYTGPDRIEPDGSPVIEEVVFVGDFESNLGWVAGLDEEAPFAVTVLDDPLRLVVDIVDEGG